MRWRRTKSRPETATADVFQLLWCPALHDDDCRPLPLVRWRAEAAIGELLDNPEPPDDEAVEDDHVPVACAPSPERVRELPDAWELDDGLRDRVEAWAQERGWRYFAHLSAADGTKAGGRPEWIQDPQYPVCDCGTTGTARFALRQAAIRICRWTCARLSLPSLTVAPMLPLTGSSHTLGVCSRLRGSAAASSVTTTAIAMTTMRPTMA